MTQGDGGLPCEARREAGQLRVRARYSLTNPKPPVCAVVSGSTSGGSRCAVGGAEGPHLRAQPRPALALCGPRPRGQYLYGAILVACSDWPAGVTTRPLRLEVEARVAGRELPAAWSAPLYLCGMWGGLQLQRLVVLVLWP